MRDEDNGGPADGPPGRQGPARRPGQKGRRGRDRGGPPRPAGPAPGEAALQAAALAHLARFAATEAGLRRVLERRIDRWARAAAAERDPAAGEDSGAIAAAAATAREAAARVARSMASAGAVDDAAFAASRAGRLARAGRSRRAIAAHLRGKGVAAETTEAALPGGEEAEVDAALALCRRRRLGPFGASAPEEREARMRALATLARAGFPRGVAEAALDMPQEEAEARILALRRG